MFEFDVKEMLEAYGNDPQALMDAFTNAVNEQLLSDKTPDERILMFATDFSNFWNDYIHYYFEQKELDMDEHEVLEFSPNEIVRFTDLLVTAIPVIKKLKEKKPKDKKRM